jgi:hypothetical protein
MDLKRFDGVNFKCISRTPDPSGVGHLYQFSCLKSLYNPGAGFPAGQAHCPNYPVATQAGFNFWSDDTTLFAQIPCPRAIQHRLGKTFRFYTSRKAFGDLEFAELSCNHDFVVGKNDNFYHDMVNHVRTRLLHTGEHGRRQNLLRLMYLKEAIMFYKRLPKKSPTLEFCFGASADGGAPFTPTYFIQGMSGNRGWNDLLSHNSIAYHLPGQFAILPACLEVIEFWEQFKPFIVQFRPDAADEELPDLQRCIVLIEHGFQIARLYQGKHHLLSFFRSGLSSLDSLDSEESEPSDS